jgi:hypothetical protein
MCGYIHSIRRVKHVMTAIQLTVVLLFFF